MPQDTPHSPLPSAPGDPAEAWCDLVLFADAAGTVVAVHGEAIAHAPDSARTGLPLWQALGLDASSLNETLRRFPPFHMHEVAGLGGRSFLLRLLPLPPALSRTGGLVAVVTDNSPRVELEENLLGRKSEVREMGIALRHVIRAVEEERQELRERLSSQVRKRMLPALDRMVKTDAPEVREGYRSVIEEHLTGLAEAGSGPLGADLLRLSPREMEVCGLIQLGRSGKEIAELLNMSFETVQTHRKNIRRKLGLRGSRTSLFAYLRNKPSLA